MPRESSCWIFLGNDSSEKLLLEKGRAEVLENKLAAWKRTDTPNDYILAQPEFED